MAASARLYDVTRIDHFIGIVRYYNIPLDKDPIDGFYAEGPGIKLIKAIDSAMGDAKVIAEDLGVVVPEVTELIKKSGYPGMKVLQFAFDGNGDNEHILHNHEKNYVAYLGTHDNDTIMGWMKTADKEDVKYAKEYLVMGKEEPYWDMIRALWSSVAGTTIIQARDLLGLGSESRMNIPSTLGGNWSWRAMPKAFNAKIANRLFRLTKLYGRLK